MGNAEYMGAPAIGYLFVDHNGSWTKEAHEAPQCAKALDA